MDSEFLKRLTLIRRKIHKNPELGNCEYKTAALVEKILKELRIPFKRISKTGVIGILKQLSAPSSQRSKCIALRADMDALPLTEKNKKSYRSQNPGVMHACGHDAHVAMLLGAAMLLVQKKKFNGTVKFLFQPNEEGAKGATSLISAGAMSNPHVDAVFGLHVNPRLPLGTIGLKEGPLMAAVDKFSVEVIGEGGHAAYPHEGKDAIPIACEIVQSLQMIVSRKIDPLEAAVVTVGTIDGGTRFNILADQVTLTGTVRTLSPQLHDELPKLIRQTIRGICFAHNVKYALNYDRIGSVLSNSKPMVELAKNVAVNLFGKEMVREVKTASMGGEDFAEYLKMATGCFIYIGTGGKSIKNQIPWHHPQFDLDERVLPVGASLLAGLTEKFLTGGSFQK